MSDIELEKHAKEYHNLTLNQFKLMCNEADKRYEGQFANAVDKHLAVESFYEGFKVGCTHPHQWQELTDDDMSIIFDKFDWKEIEIAGEHLDLFKFSHTIEQALKEKNT